MNVLEAIKNRRSVKPEHMKSTPIPREVLWELLEAANWAPSHGLTEPWRFVVFEGAARARLAEAICCTMADDSQSTLPVDDLRRAKIVTKLNTAPTCIAIVCAPSDAPKIVEHEELCSVAMAVQNLHLAARARGLAGFWSSGKKAFHPKVAELLGLSGRQRCLGFFYLGEPAQPFAEGTRRPIEDKVRFFDDD